MNKPKFNPNKPYEVADKPKFDPSQSYQEVKAPDISELESLLRGAAQGASFGFADEITGGLESLFTDKTYDEARDESRNNYKTAQEANPMSFTAGEVGGAVGTSMIPGMGFLNGAKAVTFAGRAGMAAAQGALTGAGMSEADDSMDLLKDAAIGGATGAAMQGVGEKIIAPALNKAGRFIKGNIIDKASDGVDDLLKKAGRGIANIPEADTARYLATPEAVNNSQSIGELASDLINDTPSSDSLLSQMYKKASESSSDAWNTLDPQRSISKSALKQSISDLQDSLLTDGVLLGDNQIKAHQKLAGLLQQLDQMPQNISEPTMKKIIQTLDTNINWNDPNAKVTNEALKDVRQFVDTTLKGQNPAYKTAMDKTSDVTDAIATVKKAFQNRQDPESLDKFLKSVRNLDNKSEYSSVNQALDKIKDHTGVDLREQILNSQAKSAFAKDATNGSRNTLLGSVAGGAAGSVVGPAGYGVGALVGAGVGHSADKYSGQIMKSILDGRVAAGEALPKIAGKLGKFSAPISEAAKRGNKALAATHFLLMQRDPEYRKLMREGEDK